MNIFFQAGMFWGWNGAEWMMDLCRGIQVAGWEEQQETAAELNRVHSVRNESKKEGKRNWFRKVSELRWWRPEEWTVDERLGTGSKEQEADVDSSVFTTSDLLKYVFNLL